jgi:endonuclease YncB( thermonuclease family)
VLAADASFHAVYELDNVPPVAQAAATPASGTAPLEVDFGAGGSSDPDGDALDYAWDFTDNGSWDSVAVSPTHTYATAGSHVARLRVRDPDGHADTDSVTIEVAEQPPPPPPPAAVFRFLRTNAKADLRIAVDGGGIENVRLLGLRIPGGKGSCGVKGARKKLKGMLDRGDEVALKTADGMPDSDRKGRLIRRVAEGERDVGLSLVRSGWARVRGAKRFEAIDAYLAAERDARRKGRGGWRRCDWR